MLPVARKQAIKEIINENKSVMVAELARQFKVTEETIRRDLKTLEEEGFLTRSYGGAYIQGGVMNDIKHSIRETVFVDSKNKIASACQKFIHNGDSIFIDQSTTAQFVAEAVKNMRITVLSNSLKVINLLSSSANIKIIGIGGSFSSSQMAFIGQSALQTMNDFYVDKAFVSCRSLSMQQGITDSSETACAIRRKIIERSKEVFLIADYSKFGKASFVHIAGFEAITHLVTDQMPTPDWQSFLSEQKVVLVT